MCCKIQDKIVVIIILCINCIIFSCISFSKKNTPVPETREVVTIYDYQIWLSNLDKKELRDSTVYYIDTFSMNNRIHWAFPSKDSIFYDNAYVFLSFNYFYAIEKDSFFLRNIYCPNIDTIYLKYENELFEITVSDFDIENACDEEMYVYWNHDYGLIALYNDPWGALFLIDRETKKGFAKEIFYDDFINRAKECQRLMNERLEFMPYPK